MSSVGIEYVLIGFSAGLVTMIVINLYKHILKLMNRP